MKLPDMVIQVIHRDKSKKPICYSKYVPFEKTCQSIKKCYSTDLLGDCIYRLFARKISECKRFPRPRKYQIELNESVWANKKWFELRIHIFKSGKTIKNVLYNVFFKKKKDRTKWINEHIVIDEDEFYGHNRFKRHQTV